MAHTLLLGTQTQDADTADEEISSLARDAVAGGDQRWARDQIYLTLLSMGLLDRHVSAFKKRSRFASDWQLDRFRAEADRILHHLVVTSGRLSLEMIAAGSSGVAAADSYLRASFATLVRNTVTATRDTTAPGSVIERSQRPAHDSSNEHLLRVIGDWVAERTRGDIRIRRFLDAAALRRGFQLPAPIRPHWSDRHLVADQVRADTSLARRSALVFASQLRGRDYDRSVDPRLVCIWDDYTLDDIDQVLAMSETAVHALAISAVDDRARLSNTQRTSFRREVTSLASTEEESHKFGHAADCYLAVEFTHEPLRKASHDLEALLDERNSLRKQAPVAFLAVAYPESPLGTSIDEVVTTLTSIALDYMGEYRTAAELDEAIREGE
ncbi:hypothetical protein [Nesterenkonia rhizosphaerae]|uniref:Uncharacterized protein n=1 Tax=Nesterenkonia rhizosphaerae TaxID=1348272 RepID=A0ABP9G0A5_9MICC